MASDKLALLGGIPVREKRIFAKWPILGKEEEDAVVEVIRSGNLSTFAASLGEDFYGGKNIRAFEDEFAEKFGVKEAIAVNSATAGLHCALASCGVGPGKEVIVPPYTFTATSTSVLMHNGIPVFADVDPITFCLDPKVVEKTITPHTVAILPVHLYGHPASMDELIAIAKKYNIKVIEDCAQSIGAKYKGKPVGTIGDVGVFSFQETKNLPIGEGGMIVTNNSELADRCRMIRNHGEFLTDGKPRDYITNIVGWNYRMTELEAAVGRIQLKKFAMFQNERKRVFEYLRELLKPLSGITPPQMVGDIEHGYHIFGLKYNASVIGVHRNVFVKAVQAEGIPLFPGYRRILYMNPLFQERLAYGREGCPFNCSFYKGTVSYKEGLCPVAEDLNKNSGMVMFDIRPPLGKKEMEQIAEAMKKVLDNISELKSVIL